MVKEKLCPKMCINIDHLFLSSEARISTHDTKERYPTSMEPLLFKVFNVWYPNVGTYRVREMLKGWVNRRHQKRPR